MIVLWMVALVPLALASPDDGKQEAKTKSTFVDVDYAKLPRQLTSQPGYVGDPRYALFLFGDAGDVLMWAALDKTPAGHGFYDVLWLDLDADGVLGEEGERFTAKYNEARANTGMAMSFEIPELAVPGTRHVHEGFRLATSTKKGRSGFWFQMKWRGKEKISGGYGLTGIDTTTWGESLAKAPVFRPTARGPLSFALWGAKDVRLTIGADNRQCVILGSRGSGPDTLCVLDEDFLDAKKDFLTMTLRARDRAGKELTVRTRVTGHC